MQKIILFITLTLLSLSVFAEPREQVQYRVMVERVAGCIPSSYGFECLITVKFDDGEIADAMVGEKVDVGDTLYLVCFPDNEHDVCRFTKER